MKVLVVGEAPSRWMQENGIVKPLFELRKDLAQYSGLTVTAWDELFETMNLLDAWPGKQGKGDSFDNAAGQMAARNKMAFVMCHSKVVLLGRRVEKSFALKEGPWFAWRDMGGYVGGKPLMTRCAVSPHPSGVNTWWNEPKNRAEAARFWGGLADETRKR